METAPWQRPTCWSSTQTDKGRLIIGIRNLSGYIQCLGVGWVIKLVLPVQQAGLKPIPRLGEAGPLTSSCHSSGVKRRCDLACHSANASVAACYQASGRGSTKPLICVFRSRPLFVHLPDTFLHERMWINLFMSVCPCQGPKLHHVWELGHRRAVPVLVALQLLAAGPTGAAHHLVLPHSPYSHQSHAARQGESPKNTNWLKYDPSVEQNLLEHFSLCFLTQKATNDSFQPRNGKICSFYFVGYNHRSVFTASQTWQDTGNLPYSALGTVVGQAS